MAKTEVRARLRRGTGYWGGGEETRRGGVQGGGREGGEVTRIHQEAVMRCPQ
jgi:hypothetical protein